MFNSGMYMYKVGDELPPCIDISRMDGIEPFYSNLTQIEVILAILDAHIALAEKLKQADDGFNLAIILKECLYELVDIFCLETTLRSLQDRFGIMPDHQNISTKIKELKNET